MAEGLTGVAEVGVLLLAAAGLLLALVSLRATLRFAAQPVAPPAGPVAPCTVVVPCRGEPQGFADNVRAFAAQDHPDHELLFVVDTLDDPAARALQGMEEELPRGRVLLAESDGAGAGAATGKIAALLTGAARARPESTVLVFADADARPPPGWLRSLVAPLADPAIGGASGFPWYMAGTQPTFWTLLRDAWVALALDGQGWDRFRALWGGSMAVRRADFERSDIGQRWRRMVTDDEALTGAVRALGLGIAFAPGAMVATQEDCGPEVVRWVARQYALTYTVKRGVWRISLALNGFSCVLQVLGLALLAVRPTPLLALGGALALLPSGLEVARATVRAGLPLRALPGARARPARERALQRAFAPLVPWLNVAALLMARSMSEFRWHGRTYRLGQGGERR